MVFWTIQFILSMYVVFLTLCSIHVHVDACQHLLNAIVLHVHVHVYLYHLQIMYPSFVNPLHVSQYADIHIIENHVMSITQSPECGIYHIHAILPAKKVPKHLKLFV